MVEDGIRGSPKVTGSNMMGNERRSIRWSDFVLRWQSAGPEIQSYVPFLGPPNSFEFPTFG